MRNIFIHWNQFVVEQSVVLNGRWTIVGVSPYTSIALELYIYLCDAMSCKPKISVLLFVLLLLHFHFPSRTNFIDPDKSPLTSKVLFMRSIMTEHTHNVHLSACAFLSKHKTRRKKIPKSPKPLIESFYSDGHFAWFASNTQRERAKTMSTYYGIKCTHASQWQ